MIERSVLLASNYNVWREPFNGQSYSLLNVVAGLENADIMAPGGANYLNGHAVRPTVSYLFGEAYHRIASKARHCVGHTSLSNMVQTSVTKNYDLFFFVCQFPQELAALGRMDGWRGRCRTAVCYLLETWSSSLASIAPNLRMLDSFDHVFVLNAASIPELKKYTSTPITHLAPATDCFMASPSSVTAKRPVSVYSFGRRSAVIHRQLLLMAEQSPDFIYIYDTIGGGTVGDWHEHRMLTASMMKNSRYFISFNPSDVGGGAKGDFQGEQALSTRYFEGSAGGAVMLGTVPRCAEFAENFDWPDAVIDLQPDGDIGALLKELGKKQGRVRTASKRNIAESLRRHDWSHRWNSVLACLGLPASSALSERIDTLQTMATEVL